MYRLSAVLAIIATWNLAAAHTVITYPGWRGDNLHTNGTSPTEDPGTRGIDISPDGQYSFPYGMQWMYPCGGMPLSRNRTKWPVKGGAVSVQPGWFVGHKTALIYINMGITGPGELAPPNMSHILVPPFQIVGPTNTEYPGQFCLPQVPMPVNVTLKVGDNVTIQVVEAAQHGAGIYNCVDVTLAEPEEVEEVTPQNCYNSSDIGFELVFTTAALRNAAPAAMAPVSLVALFVGFLATAIATLL